jgi:alanyl-tRNA synthetase
LKNLNATEIRQSFLDYFASEDHLVIPGAPLVPIGDPTLLYINSGMAPLKKYFLGLEAPPSKRLANYQACIRTRDIEDVGDRHHLTMFEMLGSWSIGDYYKERAVELAWKLLVDRFAFPVEKLFVSVYAGNSELGIAPDEESYRAWEKVGVPTSRIVMLGEDNFWGPAGDTGPCGPCTEVFFDTGERFGAEYEPGKEFDTKSRYIEIWNAGVFMELNKGPDGKFNPLPLKSVDTGSGVERMELVMNGFESMYENSTLGPIMGKARELFGSDALNAREYRVLTDHVRAASFILAEGVKPSNEGQGYIPRRMIRRCVTIATRAGRGMEHFEPMIDMVIELLHKEYPQLENRQRIVDAWLAEAREFEPIIGRGMDALQGELEKQQGGILSGAFAFDLVATRGVPFDIIKDYAASHSTGVDEAEFRRLFENHKNISRQEARATSTGDVSHVPDDIETAAGKPPATKFLGYDTLSATGRVLAVVKDGHAAPSLGAGASGWVVVDQSPFYAESGGQIGDTGTIEASGLTATVTNTVKRGGVWLHAVRVESGELATGSDITLKVDRERRDRIRANHSATHLLHAALHRVVGPNAVQKGSLVDDTRLRFDFQHDRPVTQDQIREIERLVNLWVRQNQTSSTQVMGLPEAIAAGAIAMFGEKYDGVVRVVRVADTSTELCGGTHVRATGDIGAFVVSSEQGVAKGIRRIEAVTGANAVDYVQHTLSTLREVAAALGTNLQLVLPEVVKLKTASRQPRAAAPAESGGLQLISESVHASPKGMKLWVARADAAPDALRSEVEKRLAGKGEDVLVLAGLWNGLPQLVVGVRAERSRELAAGELLRQLVPIVDGRGGGKATLAQGAGKDPSGLDRMLQTAAQLVDQA